jgi:hypothetical protein
MSKAKKPINPAPVVKPVETVQTAPVEKPVTSNPVVRTVSSQGSVTVEQAPVFKNPNDVSFIVDYPAGYKGAKNMEQGSVHVVSKETAEQFEQLGIGKIVK